MIANFWACGHPKLTHDWKICYTLDDDVVNSRLPDSPWK